MQKRKNIGLLVALVVVIASSILLQVNRGAQNNLGVDKRLFQLADEQEITDVYLQGKDINNHFSYKNGRWRVNNAYLLDQSMRNVFFAILSRLEIRRPVGQATADSIAGVLSDQGVRTTITFAGDTIKDYFIGGNKDLEVSWAMAAKEKVPYQVHIPGYQSFVAGIFSVPALDWRSRFVFQANFALINTIALQYHDGETLLLEATNDFFRLPDNPRADSSKIADFLDELAYLQADQFLTVDQLQEQERNLVHEDNILAVLSIQKPAGEVESVTFYNRPENEQFIIGKISDGTMARFKFGRIKSLFKTIKDFD